MTVDANAIAAAYLNIRAGWNDLPNDFNRIHEFFASQVADLQELAQIEIHIKEKARQGLFGRGGLADSIAIGAAAGVATAGISLLAQAAGKAFETIGSGFAATINASADFEQAMAEAGVAFDIFDQQGNKTFAAMRAKALQLGADTKYTSSEVARALQVFGQQGFSAEQAMEALPSTLASAAANVVAVADAAELATSVMRNFGLRAADLAHVNDAMTVAAAQSAAGFADMSYAMKYAAPVAKAAGMSLEELLAMIARLSDVNIKGEMAGTAIRGAIADLVKPSREAADELNQLGISVENIARKGGVYKVLEQLGRAKLTMSQAIKIFGIQQASPMLALLNQIDAEGRQGVASLRALVEQMNDVANVGITQKKADALMDTFYGQMERMKGAIDSLAIAMGMPLAKLLRPLIEELDRFFSELAEFNWSGLFQNMAPALDTVRKAMVHVLDNISGFLKRNQETLQKWIFLVSESIAGFVDWMTRFSAAIMKFFTSLFGLKPDQAWIGLADIITRILDTVSLLTQNSQLTWDIFATAGKLALSKLFDWLMTQKDKIVSILAVGFADALPLMKEVVAVLVDFVSAKMSLVMQKIIEVFTILAHGLPSFLGSPIIDSTSGAQLAAQAIAHTSDKQASAMSRFAERVNAIMAQGNVIQSERTRILEEQLAHLIQQAQVQRQINRIHREAIKKHEAKMVAELPQVAPPPELDPIFHPNPPLPAMVIKDVVNAAANAAQAIQGQIINVAQAPKGDWGETHGISEFWRHLQRRLANPPERKAEEQRDKMIHQQERFVKISQEQLEQIKKLLDKFQNPAVFGK